MLAAGCSGDDEDETPTAATPTHTVGTTTSAGAREEAAHGLDPDDVEGLLDLKELRARLDGDLLDVELEFWEPWRDDVLESVSLLTAGTNKLTLLYDVDGDGRSDYRGRFISSEGVLSLVISGRGQSFEPVPVERLGETVVGAVHAVDVLFVVLGEEEVESEIELELGLAARSEFEGTPDRGPDEGWILVPSV